MAIQMGIQGCDQPLVTYAWSNDVSFNGMRTIIAPAGCEPMIEDTLMWMRRSEGLTAEEAEDLGEQDYLDVLQP